MVFASSVALATIVATAACVSNTEAHGYVAKPPVEFPKGTKYPSEWVAEFSPPWTGKFKTGAQYAAVAKQKGFKNLRSFLEDKGPVCGKTNPKATPRPVPSDGKVVFSRPMVHRGPCELWLDNTLVYHNDDCELEFGKKTPVFPVNFSSCKGKCMLRFYWLGLQDSGKRWQSYKNCVPLTSNRARSIDGDDSAGKVDGGIDSVDADLLQHSAMLGDEQDDEYRFNDEEPVEDDEGEERGTKSNATTPTSRCKVKRD